MCVDGEDNCKDIDEEKSRTINGIEIYVDSIFNSLKRVQGLNGLKVKSGILNFKDTVLTTAKTASDRKIIQEIFTDATKAGTGKSKHLLRQELFEVLGGKKKALTAITDTQDKAFQAVRRGLSDLLDSKNASYKALNVEYAKVIQPLSDINRFMRLNKLAGASDDLLNMKAGLIARRLTSNAVSNPEIRFLLKISRRCDSSSKKDSNKCRKSTRFL